MNGQNVPVTHASVIRFAPATASSMRTTTSADTNAVGRASTTTGRFPPSTLCVGALRDVASSHEPGRDQSRPLDRQLQDDPSRTPIGGVDAVATECPGNTVARTSGNITASWSDSPNASTATLSGATSPRRPRQASAHHPHVRRRAPNAVSAAPTR